MVAGNNAATPVIACSADLPCCRSSFFSKTSELGEVVEALMGLSQLPDAPNTATPASTAAAAAAATAAAAAATAVTKGGAGSAGGGAGAAGGGGLGLKLTCSLAILAIGLSDTASSLDARRRVCAYLSTETNSSPMYFVQLYNVVASHVFFFPYMMKMISRWLFDFKIDETYIALF